MKRKFYADILRKNGLSEAAIAERLTEHKSATKSNAEIVSENLQSAIADARASGILRGFTPEDFQGFTARV